MIAAPSDLADFIAHPENENRAIHSPVLSLDLFLAISFWLVHQKAHLGIRANP